MPRRPIVVAAMVVAVGLVTGLVVARSSLDLLEPETEPAQPVEQTGSGSSQPDYIDRYLARLPARPTPDIAWRDDYATRHIDQFQARPTPDIAWNED